MKKFFKNLLAIALVGVMVGNVACNKYDDDINGLTERLDKIEGTMALKTDVQALQSTVSALNAIDFNAFMKSADFASMLEKAGVSKDQILVLIEDLQSADDVAATFEGMMKAYDIWGKIEAAIVEAFGGAEGADVKATIDGWLGKAFAEYMKDYTTTADMNQKIADANKALKDEILKAIQNGESTSAGLAVRIDAIEQALKAYDVRIAELLGRIQSLVWKPSTSTELQYGMAYLESYYIKMDKGNKSKYVLMSKPELQLTWKVSPAAIASKIKPEHLSIVTEEVEARASLAPSFEIVDAEIKDGEITVNIATATNLYDLREQNGTVPMVALNVAVPAAEEGVQGIDFTSEFVGINPSNWLFNTGVIGYAHESESAEEAVVAFGGTHMHEIEYTDLSKNIFLEGGYVAVGTVVNQKPAYVDVVEYFDAFDAEEGWLELVCYPEVDAKKNPVSATITNADAVGKFVTLAPEGFGITKSDIALIGETVTSPEFTFVIEDAEGYSFTLGTVREAYEITTITVPVAVAAQTFNWTYANATDNNTYVKEGLSLSGLTAEQYLAVKNAAGEYTIKDAKGKAVAADVAFDFFTTPTANSDVQLFNMTISDADEFATAGEYVVVGKFLIDDCMVEITVPVTVAKGMPTLNNVDLGEKVYTFDGQWQYDILDNNGHAALWEANKMYADQISEEEFEEMLDSAATPQVGDIKFAKVYRTGGKIVAVFAEAALDKAAQQIGTEFKHVLGLKASILVKAALAKPEVEFVANDYYVVNGRTLLKTEFNGTAFDIEQKDINLAYTAKGAEGLVLSYSVDTADKAQKAAMDKLVGTKPAVTNGVVYWNDWNQTELILRVTATLNGVEVGSQTFVAYIVDPVEEAISILLDSKKKPVDLTLYAGESKNTFGVLYLEANEKNIFTATGLDADLQTALNGSVEFETEELNSALTFDKTTGVISVADSGMAIQGDHKVVVKVVYTYQFGYREFAVEYVVKPGTRE